VSREGEQRRASSGGRAAESEQRGRAMESKQRRESNGGRATCVCGGSEYEFLCSMTEPQTEQGSPVIGLSGVT